jgi:NADH-quinone oxidoreductase subunit M
MVERVFVGPPSERWAHLPDATEWWERTAMAAMLIPIFTVGLYPQVLMRVVETGIEPIAAIVGAAG